MSTNTTLKTQASESFDYVPVYLFQLDTTTVSVFGNDLSIHYLNLTAEGSQNGNNAQITVTAFDQNGNNLGSDAANQSSGTCVLKGGATATQLIASCGSQTNTIYQANYYYSSFFKISLWMPKTPIAISSIMQNGTDLTLSYSNSDSTNATITAYDSEGNELGNTATDSSQGIAEISLPNDNFPAKVVVFYDEGACPALLLRID